MENNENITRTRTENIAVLEIELQVLKEKISNHVTSTHHTLDLSVEKIEQYMENRRAESERLHKQIYDKIEQLENKLMNEISSFKEIVSKEHGVTSSRISDLDKWRWIVVGASAVVGWILSTIFGRFSGGP
jgi:glucosamine 6-phosphate synthetase-like amidotransferase/phosphosugar isomerase protein